MDLAENLERYYTAGQTVEERKIEKEKKAQQVRCSQIHVLAKLTMLNTQVTETLAARPFLLR